LKETEFKGIPMPTEQAKVRRDEETIQDVKEILEEN